jgi:hypothetical protein
VAKTGNLREDERHPVAALPYGLQFGNDTLVQGRLSDDEAFRFFGFAVWDTSWASSKPIKKRLLAGKDLFSRERQIEPGRTIYLRKAL